MAITLEDAGGLPEESAQGDIQDPHMASKRGGVDRRRVCGYSEERLEVDLDIEGCPRRACPTVNLAKKKNSDQSDFLD